MIPKSGHRFSEKIMLKQYCARNRSAFGRAKWIARRASFISPMHYFSCALVRPWLIPPDLYSA
jgi:hypothetical protein